MSGLAAGTILNSRYKVQRPIGEGASGAVYLVRDTRDRGCLWAMKEMWSPDPEVEQTFRNEAALLQALSHPAIPVLQDFFTQNGRLYLVMERVEGPTLEAVLAESGGPLPEGEVLEWGVQLCDFLGYLHGRTPPVIYRDLKPSNCMLTRGNRIQVVDLGIGRVFNPSRPRDTQAYGTPGFCPPEQYAGHSTPASDLYALGVTLFVLLSAADPESFRFQFPPLRTLRPEVSSGCENLLCRALDLDPARRFESAAQMGMALRAVLGDLGRPMARLWRAVVAWRGSLASVLAGRRKPPRGGPPQGGPPPGGALP